MNRRLALKFCVCALFTLQSSLVDAACAIAPDGSGKVVIPATWTSIGGNSFKGCELITIEFEVDSQLTSIGQNAFNNAIALTGIVIPKGVTSIGDNAFSGCSKLATVTFEADSAMTSIGESAFYNAVALTGIIIKE